ncbi:MAG: NRDE family protein [Gammaproteobacteria bacterium]|nr:MAG: NRDE family protein [Gammaproteobacteria bacterium]
MCLILIALNRHPDLPLIVAANRDEFHSRPTQPLGFWQDRPALLAGRDLEAGGTWLGVARGGRLAAVTNIRGETPGKRGERSRGALAVEYLTGNLDAAEYMQSVAAERGLYGPFNLVLYEQGCLHACGSVTPPACHTSGLHAISNGALDEPWPRSERGLAGLTRILDSDDFAREEAYLDLLADRTTGMPEPPLFILGDRYGTRCSSVILRTAAGSLSFVERSFRADGTEGETRRFEIVC